MIGTLLSWLASSQLVVSTSTCRIPAETETELVLQLHILCRIVLYSKQWFACQMQASYASNTLCVRVLQLCSLADMLNVSLSSRHVSMLSAIRVRPHSPSTWDMYRHALVCVAVAIRCSGLGTN